MDSDTDDELSYLKPQLFSWKTSHIPIIEIPNTADDEYEASSRNNSTCIKYLNGAGSRSPVRKKRHRVKHRHQDSVSESNLHDRVHCPQQKNDSIITTFNKENQADGLQKIINNVSRTDNQENPVNRLKLDNANFSGSDSQGNKTDGTKWSCDSVSRIESKDNNTVGHQSSNDNVSKADSQDNLDDRTQTSNISVSGTESHNISADCSQSNSDNVDRIHIQVCHSQCKCDSVVKTDCHFFKTDCQQNQAECQTTITGDVFALNFYHGNDFVSTVPIQGVDSLLTLDDIEVCLPSIQCSFASPAQFVETENSSMQTEGPLQNTDLPKILNSCTNCGDGRLRGNGAERTNQIVQTDFLEMQSQAGWIVQVPAAEVECLDKAMQTEHFRRDTHRAEEIKRVETVNQSVQTECLEVLTGICTGQEHTENADCKMNISDRSVNVEASVSGDVTTSNIRQDSKSLSLNGLKSEQIKSMAESSWLDRLFFYSAVPLVIRFIFVGMCAILNFIHHHM